MLAIVALPMSAARAQTGLDQEPAILVSVSDINEQLADIGYLMDAAGFGGFAFMVDMQAKEFLKGVDMKRPAGAALFFQEDRPEPDFVAFIPVSNLDDFLNVISDFAEVDEDGDLVTIVTDDGTELTLKESNGFAFLTANSDLLDDLPADPTRGLGSLPKDYNLSAKIFGQRIPEGLREQALTAIKDSYENQLDELGDEEMAEFQRANFKMQMAQLESAINETDELVLGMAIDKDSKTIYFDMKMTGIEGSKMAKQAAAAADVEKSRFAGFLMKDAAFTFNACSEIMKEDAESLEGMVSELKKAMTKQFEEELEGEELEVVQGIADGLIDTLVDTLKEGRIDGGGVVMLGEDSINFAAGMHIANPKDVEDHMKKVAAMARERAEAAGDEVTITMNADSYDGATFHKAVIKVPENEEEARKFFGDEVTILVGIGEKTVYVGAGSDPMSTLKQAIDASKSASTDGMPSVQYNLFLAPVLRLVARAEQQEMAMEMAKAMEESGNDRIRIEGRTIKNGSTMRFEMQDGVLKLIGMVAQQFGGMGGGADF